MIVELSLPDLIRCLSALKFKQEVYKQRLGKKGEVVITNCGEVIKRISVQIKKGTFKPKQ